MSFLMQNILQSFLIWNHICMKKKSIHYYIICINFEKYIFLTNKNAGNLFKLVVGGMGPHGGGRGVDK